MDGHVWLDHAFIAAFIVLTLVEWLWYWPKCLRVLTQGVPGVRARIYRNLLIAEWGISLGVAGLWVARGRPWSGLYLGASSALRLGIGMALAAAFVCFQWMQRRAVLARPALQERVRQKISYAEALLPHTESERKGFMWVALTAGICEEFFCRGFMMWYFGVWGGVVFAALLSSILFGFGHIYWGIRQVPKTGAFGAVLAILVIATGSLWPGIIIHAATDMVSGDVAFHALSAAPASGDGADALAAG